MAAGPPDPAGGRVGRGITLALVAAALFGISGSVAFDAFDRLRPAQVAQARSLIALAVLAPVAWRRRQIGHGGRLIELVGLGSVLAGVTVTYYLAIERLGVGPGVTIQFLGPVLVLFWIRLVRRRIVPGPAWTAAGLAVAGVALVAGVRTGSTDRLGLAWALVSAVLFAAYLIIGERLVARLSALAAITYGLAFSSLIWLVFVPLPRTSELLASAPHLLWIGLAGTAAPFLIQMEALRAASAGLVGVTATAEPVMAAAAAWLALGQRMGALQMAGTAMVVAAVATIQRTRPSWVPGPQ